MLAIFLIYLTFSRFASVFTQNESLILVQDFRNVGIHCVTSEIDRAVIWNHPLDTKFQNAIKVTFPNKTYREIDWERQNSLKVFFDVVLDSRWESFPLVMSISTLYLEFILLREINESDTFEIPISVRTNEEAHIYICETSKRPFENSCYWFILGGWGGMKSVLRKCKVNEISKNNVGPKGNCRTNVEEVDKNPLESDRYIHFTIKFSSKNKSISLNMHGEREPFLKYIDLDYNEFQTYKSIWVNSRRSNVGFWRIHDYNFFIMRNFTSGEILRTGNRSSVCISMYATVCLDCSFTLILRDYHSKRIAITKDHTFKEVCGDVIVNVQAPKLCYVCKALSHIASQCEKRSIKCFDCGKIAFCGSHYLRIVEYREIEEGSVRLVLYKPDPRADSIWQKVVISYNGVLTNYVLEVVSPPNKITPFLALDKISVTTICPIKEIKYSTLTTNIEDVSCEFLTGGGKIESRPLSNIAELDLRCPLNTFGPDCLPCSILENNCRFSKICEYQNHNEVCYCSAGFTDQKCDAECPVGTFGLHCIQHCGQCYKSLCNPDDGYCWVGCTRPFKGEHCNETKDPILKEASKLLKECYTTCRFSINPENYRGTTLPVYYRQFYRLYGGEWWEGDKDIDISEKEFTITNLEKLKPYEVKVALCTSNDSCYSDVIPVLNFMTHCKELQKSDVVLNISSYSAVFTISNKTVNNDNCPLNAYILIVTADGSEVSNRRLANLHYIYLLPHRQYKYVINNTNSGAFFTGIFTSEETEPGEVTNLKITSAPEELDIFWDAPSAINGIITGYYVRLEHQSYIYCRRNGEYINDTKLNYQVNVTNQRATFKNLHPYSKYLISIRAMNKFIGKAYEQVAETMESGKFNKDAYTVSIKYMDDRVAIKLTSNCTLVYSPFIASVELKCSEKYCPPPINRNFGTASILAINLLLPYTEYRLLTRIMNKFSKENQLHEVYFLTKPSVPNTVRNFELYATGNSSMHFRFLPPYPPTGVIETYWMKVTKETIFFDRLVNYDTAIHHKECEIWPWMLCTVISNLKYKDYYLIELTVKNKDVSRFSEKSHISAYLEQLKPEPPLNLIGTWDDFYNLTINWQHPNKSNGNLTTFNIHVNDYAHSYRIKKFNLTYTYKIQISPHIQELATNVSINSENENQLKSDFVTYKINNPPPMPALKVYPTITQLSNHTVTIKISEVINQTRISYLYIIVAKDKSSFDPEVSEKQLNLLQNWIELSKDKSGWIAKEYKLNNELKTLVVVVGNGERMLIKRTNETITNWYLHADTSFRIYVVALNKRGGLERHRIYSLIARTTAVDNAYNPLIYISFLLIIIPVVYLVYYARKRRVRLTCLSSAKSSSRSNNAAYVEISDTVPLAEKQATIAKERKVPPKYSKMVNLVDFEEYVRESIFNDELARQHALLAKSEIIPKIYEDSLMYKSTNGYLISYNESGLKLQKLPIDEYPDFISANYIKGTNGPKAYIVTVDPNPNTVSGFWQMIWAENVANIVMLTNAYQHGNKKIEKYWPDCNQDIDFADIKIRHVSTEIFADFEIRNFVINYDGEERKIEQLHYTTWPENDVPLYPQSLVPFLRRFLLYPRGTKPILVHCSNNVGRTGIIILIDLCLRMAPQMAYIDPFHHLHQLRMQEKSMVDHIEEYKLAHLVILECLFSPVTAIPCDGNFEEGMKNVINKDLQKHMKYIETSAWQENAIVPKREINRKIYPEKDRFPGTPVENYGLVYLPPYPPSDESSTYINATAVDGFRSKKRFIATQNPLPNTMGDFWRLVLENDVSIIVSLQEIDLDNPTCCQFFPSKKIKVVKAIPKIAVHHIQTEIMENHMVVSVSLHYNGDQRKIKIIFLKEWKFGELCASNKNALLAAWRQMNNLSLNENKIIVTCRDGITASGLYLAMCFMLEKIKLEQICDICHAVRVIRRSRRQFVQSKEQFIALYRIADLYLGGFRRYANFGSEQ